MATCSGISTLSKARAAAARGLHTNHRRRGDDFPNMEEELSLNVRRALKELRQDLQVPPESQAVELLSSRDPPTATLTGVKECSQLNTLIPGPNQYVVDCVDGKIRVTAVAVEPTKATAGSETKVKADDVAPPELDLSSQPAVVSRSHSARDMRPMSLWVPSSSATADSNLEPTVQPLRFTPDSSCCSTTDDESGVVDLIGACFDTVASWVRIPRDACAPHPRYYFADGTLELQVEDSLYKVHRHFFEHYSSFFVALFTSLSPRVLQASRLSLEDSALQFHSPIHLPDITTIEFDRLLSIIYPNSFASCDITSMEEWISVLNLSSKLEFTTIRDLAINTISPNASVTDKALLGKRYGIKSWVMDAYSELCTRERPLSLEEGRKLGIDLVIKVNELRHELFFSTEARMVVASKVGPNPLVASASSFDELPERVAQHFKLHVMDDGTPEDEGVYFKAVLVAN